MGRTAHLIDFVLYFVSPIGCGTTTHTTSKRFFEDTKKAQKSGHRGCSPPGTDGDAWYPDAALYRSE